MPNITTRTVTISDGTDTSDAVLIEDGELVGIQTDSAWDTQDITFTTSATSGDTFVGVYDATNTAVTVTSATASRYYTLASAGIKGLQWIKLVSAANQSGDTVLTLIILQR